MFSWFFFTQQAQEHLRKLLYKSQPAGAKRGHFLIFKISYLDTTSQLHFISCSTVFYRFYHSFCTVTSNFWFILVAGFIVQCHVVVMCAAACATCNRTTPAPMAMSQAWLTIALELVFLLVGIDLDTYPWPCSSFYNPVLYCNHKGCLSLLVLWPCPLTSQLKKMHSLVWMVGSKSVQTRLK